MVNHSHKISGKGTGAHSYHQKGTVVTNSERKRSVKAPQGPKIHKVMHEFKHHTLHSGSKHGPQVKSRKQAVAIAINEQRKQNRKS